MKCWIFWFLQLVGFEVEVSWYVVMLELTKGVETMSKLTMSWLEFCQKIEACLSLVIGLEVALHA